MRELIAKTRLLYAGRRREAGDAFTASPAHARLLVKTGRAVFADHARPRADLPPIPETLRNRALAGKEPAVPTREVAALETQANAASAPEAAASAEAEELEQARADYREIFGRKPYHGWDAATVREKIAERDSDAS